MSFKGWCVIQRARIRVTLDTIEQACKRKALVPQRGRVLSFVGHIAKGRARELQDWRVER